MPKDKPTLEFLRTVGDTFGAHPFSDEDLSELVEPKLGMITSFKDLMDELDQLRTIDLGALPPALEIKTKTIPSDE